MVQLSEKNAKVGLGNNVQLTEKIAKVCQQILPFECFESTPARRNRYWSAMVLKKWRGSLV